MFHFRWEQAASSASALRCCHSLRFFLSMTLTLSSHLSRSTSLIHLLLHAQLSQGSKFASSWFSSLAPSRCADVPCNNIFSDHIFMAHSQNAPAYFVPSTLRQMSCSQSVTNHLLCTSFLKSLNDNMSKVICPVQYQSKMRGSWRLPVIMNCRWVSYSQ